jgi:hypothetical protein
VARAHQESSSCFSSGRFASAARRPATMASLAL